MKRLFLGLIACAITAAIGAGHAEAAGSKSVTISGRAYAFNHMDTFLAGATIRVREDASLSAVTDANGDYSLQVPQNATITPYIDPPDGYNEIDLQTFHTRKHDIANANFQTPADPEYKGLAALLGVPLDADGRPQQCVIVTTASRRNVRGVDYNTFWARTPHGVAGASSTSQPALPDPTYFNESVIPDPSQPYTSGDGGIVWAEVDTGAYRISTDSPKTDFASFLANCAPGRVINANPPWGAYELKPGEEPLRAGGAVGGLSSAKPKRGKVVARLDASEALDGRVKLVRRSGKKLASKPVSLQPGGADVGLKARGNGRAKLTAKLTDAAGETRKESRWVKLPLSR